MNQQFGYALMCYVKAITVDDPTAAEGWRDQDHMILVLKAVADEQEYQHDFLIDADMPKLDQIQDWQKQGKMLVVTSSTLRTAVWDHKEKDEEGNPKKYPKAGKIFKVGNKQIEIGNSQTFQSYAVRVATTEEEQLTQQAHGRYMVYQQGSRARSIQKQLDKAEALNAKRKKEITDKRKKVS